MSAQKAKKQTRKNTVRIFISEAYFVTTPYSMASPPYKISSAYHGVEVKEKSKDSLKGVSTLQASRFVRAS